jgi:hypothetical protein
VNRPSETLTAFILTMVGAAIQVLQQFYPEVAAKITPNITTAIVTTLAWTATIVTYFVTRRLRSPDSPLVSEADGSVSKDATLVDAIDEGLMAKARRSPPAKAT